MIRRLLRLISHKPRIRYVKHLRCWECSSRKGSALGMTPKSAFQLYLYVACKTYEDHGREILRLRAAGHDI